jgi:amino acid permease
MTAENQTIGFIIAFMIILFEVYYLFSEENHQKFFETVGAALILITFLSGYFLFTCLKLKTKKVRIFNIEPSLLLHKKLNLKEKGNSKK